MDFLEYFFKDARTRCDIGEFAPSDWVTFFYIACLED
jgi:hypothetical protein